MSPRPASRGQAGFWAFALHRLSGVLLALFLPFHFLALGTAIEGAGALDAFLTWTDVWYVKVAEWGLVILLTAHLSLGLRLIAIEFGRWRGARKAWIGWGAALALLAGALFIVSAA